MPDEARTSARQGSAQPWSDRLPLPDRAAMTEQQRETADVLSAGPRKGVFGPFVPLLRSPVLLDRVARLGEYLRFESVLDARVRELVTCAAARHVSNQFEWVMHAPLAVAAGVSATAVEALRQGARPTGLAADEEAALDFAQELLRGNGVSETSYGAAAARFNEQGVVELATLVGYFVMVCWVMNAAHTPAQDSEAAPLPPFPL
jgi:4-carboxymuconolactone decarboxylase